MISLARARALVVLDRARASILTVRLRRAGHEVGARLRVRGRPLLQLEPGATLMIGSDVLLDSRNRGYHAQMTGPVKLVCGSAGRIFIGDETRIHGSCIHARAAISIGRGCLVAAGCNIIDSHGHPLSMDDPARRLTTRDEPRQIDIGPFVWLGLGSTVLPGTTIGTGSVVGAGAVVRGLLPSATVYSRTGPAGAVRDGGLQ
jgi:acetyltransferase-like isoleucine patch superfamily enzyme